MKSGMKNDENGINFHCVHIQCSLIHQFQLIHQPHLKDLTASMLTLVMEILTMTA